MLVGIAFISVLTATVASLFVKNDREESTLGASTCSCGSRLTSPI
jgi:hypothetical protein